MSDPQHSSPPENPAQPVIRQDCAPNPEPRRPRPRLWCRRRLGPAASCSPPELFMALGPTRTRSLGFSATEPHWRRATDDHDRLRAISARPRSRGGRRQPLRRAQAAAGRLFRREKSVSARQAISARFLRGAQSRAPSISAGRSRKAARMSDRKISRRYFGRWVAPMSSIDDQAGSPLGCARSHHGRHRAAREPDRRRAAGRARDRFSAAAKPREVDRRLAALAQAGLIVRQGDELRPRDWDDRQYETTSTARVQKHREKRKGATY